MNGHLAAVVELQIREALHDKMEVILQEVVHAINTRKGEKVMNVQTIEMDSSEAFGKARKYRERIAQMKPSLANAEVHSEYETILKGYEALAKGTPLIDLDQVMANAPLDLQNRWPFAARNEGNGSACSRVISACGVSEWGLRTVREPGPGFPLAWR